MSELGDTVAQKHGAGGPAMRALIEKVFVVGLGPAGAGLAAMDDGAAIPVGDRFLVLTTDSYVIKPLFFPGGDIGRLAICGTVNDLSMMGATEPLGLTCAVIIEAGFPLVDLERIRDSMRATCAESDASIVTGDTKVMGKGEVDGIVLNTTGVALTRLLEHGPLTRNRLGELSGLSKPTAAQMVARATIPAATAMATATPAASARNWQSSCWPARPTWNAPNAY